MRRQIDEGYLFFWCVLDLLLLFKKESIFILGILPLPNLPARDLHVSASRGTLRAPSHQLQSPLRTVSHQLYGTVGTSLNLDYTKAGESRGISQGPCKFVGGRICGLQ